MALLRRKECELDTIAGLFGRRYPRVNREFCCALDRCPKSGSRRRAVVGMPGGRIPRRPTAPRTRRLAADRRRLGTARRLATGRRAATTTPSGGRVGAATRFRDRSVGAARGAVRAEARRFRLTRHAIYARDESAIQRGSRPCGAPCDRWEHPLPFRPTARQARSRCTKPAPRTIHSRWCLSVRRWLARQSSSRRRSTRCCSREPKLSDSRRVRKIHSHPTNHSSRWPPTHTRRKGAWRSLA